MRNDKSKAPFGGLGAVLQNILHLTGLTEEAYESIRHQYGVSFAYYYTNNNPISFSLIKTKSYQQWWNQQWSLRDQAFIAEYQSYVNTGSENELFDLYLEANAPDAIAGYPGKWIMDEAWQQMINQVDEEEGGVLC